MIYINNNSNDPAYNIALEEYAFKKLRQFDSIFLLWINSPTIVVGRHQNTIEEINSDFIKNNHIKVVRRISGGGAVYHDLNNLNYTIISNENEEKAFDFKSFSYPVINTLKTLGVTANFTGRNDLEINGKKICGNAQAYINGRIMHHGCLLFDVNLGVLSEALKVSRDKIESKGVKSVRARVTNILDELPRKISVLEFKSLILKYMKDEYKDMEEYVLTEEDKLEIEKIRKEKFSNWDWTYGKSPDYNIERKNKFPSGKVDVYMDIRESLINNIKIYGDFFGIEDVSAIEEILKGTKYKYEDILEKLKNIDIKRYFMGLTAEDITKAIID